MTVIKVPKPPDSAMNPDRPVSSLLKNQIIHLQEAEFRLPAHRQSNIYINDIKTEGEAAEYIRQVTAQLHPQGSPRVARIAAMADTKAPRKKRSASNRGKKSRKKTRAVARSKTRRNAPKSRNKGL